MDKVFVISTVIYKNNLVETESAVYTDKESAKVCISDLFKYYRSISPESAPIYDGYDGAVIYWFEIGETTDNYFIRCELKQNNIN